MSYLDSQISFLQKAIKNGVITKDCPLLIEQKDSIIEVMARMIESSGYPINRSELGAYVDKRFADELGID